DREEGHGEAPPRVDQEGGDPVHPKLPLPARQGAGDPPHPGGQTTPQPPTRASAHSAPCSFPNPVKTELIWQAPSLRMQGDRDASRATRPGSQGGTSALKPIHLPARKSPAILVITLLAVCLLGAATALPAAASGKEFEPTWPPSKKTPSGPPAFQGGGGFSLSLLYVDVDALNAKIQQASQEGWNLPTFAPGEPLVLWGGGGGAGGERVRFGGFGGGGELLEKSNNGASRFSLGFGGVTLHYVIRPGVES